MQEDLVGALDSMSFPGSSVGKEFACSAGEPGLIPGSGRSLKKAMATYSSILAWKITWVEEPGRLQSMGLERVGHESANEHAHACLDFHNLLDSK